MCPRNELSARPHARRGVTLIELLVACTVLALMAAALGALTQAVKVSAAYSEGRSLATQHARVVMQRISMAMADSHANESFPGAVRFTTVVGAYDYPDTLVVWRPSGSPAAANGLPKFNEIVVFSPNPNAPNELLEITAPADARSVPAITDTATWNTELSNLRTGTSSQKVLLTDLLRTATPTGGGATRGVVRFTIELRPSEAEWASFRAGTISFSSVPWVQTIYGSQTGLRQTWVATELQMQSGYNAAANPATQAPIPFFGSAASYWELRK